MEMNLQHFIGEDQQQKFALDFTSSPCKLFGMEIGERIKIAREKIGVSQSELARRIGVKPQSVQVWEAGRNGPSRKRITILARELKVSPHWLEFGEEPQGLEGERQRKVQELEETNLTAKEFPLISWVQAGQWSEIVDNFQPGDAETWVPFGISRRDIPNGFCLRVRGDSMEPEFADGDIILVDPHKQPENGQFVIAKLLDTNEATFKKYVIDAGVISLHPLNYPKHQPIHLNGRKALIVGVVVGKQKMY